MKKEMKFAAKRENITAAVEFIENMLKLTALDQKKIYKNTLAAEETLLQIIKNADSERSIVTVRITTRKKLAKIGISCKGSEWKPEVSETLLSEMKLTGLEDEQASVISHMLINAMGEHFKVRHSRGINFAQLDIRSEKAGGNNAVFLFMLAGIVLGSLMRLLAPADVCGFVSSNIFSLGSTMFMNAMKMVVAPLVFFSIAESMTGFSDYKVFGRIGGKVITLYFLTTVIAISVGYAVFQLTRPGDPSQINAVLAVAGTTETQTASTLSLRELLTGIIPENLAGAFHSGDMLQIIFIAMLIGMASGSLGEYSHCVQEFIRAGNSLFTRITNMILKLLPPATLCFMANTVLTMDMGSFASLAKVLAVIHVALLVMIFVYGILLVLVKIDPLAFFSGFKGAMLTAFSTASSNGSIPVTMGALDKMGISPQVYSFSIPLGSTINMHGSSIGYVLIVLFMMRIFDIQLNTGMLFSLFLSVTLLSVGTPGIPGASIAMTALLFTQFGIPAGAVGFVIPLIMLGEYARTMSNVTGDAVVTAIVAKSEGLVDMTRLSRKKDEIGL